MPQEELDYLAGVDNSYAEKVNGKWIVHGTSAVDHQKNPCYFYKLENIADLNKLPNDVPVFSSWTSNTTIAPNDAKLATKSKLDDLATDSLLSTHGSFPINQHNVDIVAQKILERSDVKNFRTLDVDDGYGLDEVHWKVQDDLVEGIGTDEEFQDLDGWFLDPRIGEAQSKPVVRDETVESRFYKEFESVDNFLKESGYAYSFREADFDDLNDNLEIAGLQRLDKKRTTPRYLYQTANGSLQTVSERELIERAIKLVEDRYANDGTKASVIKVLKQQPFNEDDEQAQRLKLAAKIVEQNDHIKLQPIEKGLAEQVKHLVPKAIAKQIQRKPKER